MRFITWLSFSLLAFIRPGVFAQSPSYDFSRLDLYLATVAGAIPSGFEVALVQNGEMIYWKQYGPWTKDKQASIASATKWFSGALILSLTDDGSLSLDDRASKYLPYLTGEKESITIRQLMSHTAGFPGEFPLAHPCLEDPDDTLDHCARALAEVPLQAPPGAAFIYAGAGMQIAGRVAEVATGKDWQTLFRERIAEPLGLTATDYEYKGPTRNPRISGGARSNVSDYMKFLTMIGQRGVYQGRRILSTRAIDTMLADQTQGVPIVESPFERAMPNNRYGIGNWVEQTDPPGVSLENSSIGVAGWTPLLDRRRNLQVVVGMQNILRPFQPYYLPMKRILASIIPPAALIPEGITNAASYEAGPIVAGEVLALFGQNLGPEQPVASNGVLLLGGTQVTFDGVAAPLLYASSGQVTAVAPATVTGNTSTRVQVTYNGAASPAVTVPVADAWPALFTADSTGEGPAVALNADGTLNHPLNPASPGSPIVLFGTGSCTNPQSAVAVKIADLPAAVLSCEPAFGLAPGVFQLRAIVPDVPPSHTRPLPVVIEAGGVTSPPAVTIAVQ